jgi:hypothetical protein
MVFQNTASAPGGQRCVKQSPAATRALGTTMRYRAGRHRVQMRAASIARARTAERITRSKGMPAVENTSMYATYQRCIKYIVPAGAGRYMERYTPRYEIG